MEGTKTKLKKTLKVAHIKAIGAHCSDNAWGNETCFWSTFYDFSTILNTICISLSHSHPSDYLIST